MSLFTVGWPCFLLPTWCITRHNAAAAAAAFSCEPYISFIAGNRTWTNPPTSPRKKERKTARVIKIYFARKEKSRKKRRKEGKDLIFLNGGKRVAAAVVKSFCNADGSKWASGTAQLNSDTFTRNLSWFSTRLKTPRERLDCKSLFHRLNVTRAFLWMPPFWAFSFPSLSCWVVLYCR